MDKKPAAGFEPPDLAPVIVTEHTRSGWRGLTADGEILNVNAHVNGEPARIPDSLGMVRGDQTIGYRKIEQQTSDGVIVDYLHHLEESTRLTRLNEHEAALDEINAAMAYAPTALARYNRAMIMLALGYFSQGFDDFARCERECELFMRPQFKAALDVGMTPWRGQDIRGKKLLLIHDHGFGDTLMCLRYIATLKAMGANVILDMPQELRRLAVQHAPVVTSIPGPPPADYVCSMLMLMQVLQEFPGEWRGPYLRVDPTLVAKWKPIVFNSNKNIGIAWSVGRSVNGDYPRECPQHLFEQYLAGDGRLISVQQHQTGDSDDAFIDFADCAALMSLMDEIVTVDTAAVHLAGAIGHPNITLLLSRWHSWRWQMPLYPNMKICVQTSDGDWGSAFAQRRDAVFQGSI
jgi:hypothetical protein